MALIGPLAYILAITSGLTIITKRPFQRVLPMSMIGSVLVLYLFGLFNVLWLGFWFLLALAFFSVFWTFKSLKSSNIPDFRSWILTYLVTPGLLLFLVLYGYFFFLNLNRGYSAWDEFSHWGMMVKEMVRTGNLYDLPSSLSDIHKDYPPAMQLIRYLFCMLGGGYSESLCYTSSEILVFSFFISVFNFKWSRWNLFYAVVFITSSILISLWVSSAEGTCLFLSTYVDIPLALTSGYVLYLSVSTSSGRQPGNFLGGLLYKNKDWSLSRDFNCKTKDSNVSRSDLFFSFELVDFSFVLIFLVLVKPTALVFVGLAILIFFFNRLLSVSNKNAQKESSVSHINTTKVSSNSIRSTWLTLGYLLVITVLFYLSWMVRTKVYGNESQGVLNLESFWTVLFGSPEAWQVETAQNFTNAIWNNVIAGIMPGIGLNYPTLIIILLFALLIARLLFWDLRRVILITIAVVFGAFLYAFMMFILYQTQFGSYEGPRLASFQRYITTFPLAISIFLLCSFFRYLSVSASMEKNQKKFYHTKYVPKIFAASFTVLLIFIFPNGLYPLLIPPTSNTSSSESLTPAADLIMSNTEKGSSVYMVSELGFESVYLGYKIFQHNNINWHDMSSAWGKPKIDLVLSDKDIGYRQPLTNEDNISPEQFLIAFQNANVDYVYFCSYDEYFAQTYSSLFPELAQGKLYSITDNGFELVA
jgi:hypothetical protein